MMAERTTKGKGEMTRQYFTEQILNAAVKRKSAAGELAATIFGWLCLLGIAVLFGWCAGRAW